MILTQFYAGLRVNELINLTFEDLKRPDYKPNDNFQVIKISYKSAKYGKERVSYIPTFVYKRIIEWISQNILKNYHHKIKNYRLNYDGKFLLSS